MNHVSLTYEEINYSFLDITNLAEDSRKRYSDKVILGLNVDDSVQGSVYVKKEEKSLISNKIKSEIADTISNLFFSTKEENSLIPDKTKSKIADTWKHSDLWFEKSDISDMFVAKVKYSAWRFFSRGWLFLFMDL